MMRIGGNQRFKDFMARYDVADASFEAKYHSPAASIYRSMMSAEARGEPFTVPPPSDDNRGPRKAAAAGPDMADRLGSVESQPPVGLRPGRRGGDGLDDIAAQVSSGFSLLSSMVSRGVGMAASAAKTGIEKGRTFAQASLLSLLVRLPPRLAGTPHTSGSAMRPLFSCPDDHARAPQEHQLDERARQIGASASTLGAQGWGMLRSWATSAAQQVQQFAESAAGAPQAENGGGQHAFGREVSAHSASSGHGGVGVVAGGDGSGIGYERLSGSERVGTGGGGLMPRPVRSGAEGTSGNGEGGGDDKWGGWDSKW